MRKEMKNLEAFDLSCFRGISHFENDGTQNYIAFQTVYKNFKITTTSYNFLK